MMLLRQFNRQTTVIKLEQFGAPKIGSFSALELPRGSILHYVPADSTAEMGPPQSLPMLTNSDKLVQVNHNVTLSDTGLIGRPRKIEKNLTKDIMLYHRINKKLRRMHSESLVERDDRTLFVENYAPLRNAYRYPQTLMSWYDRYHNIMTTVVERMGRDADKFERQNYLMLTIPDVLASKAKLRRAERRRDNITLDGMRDDNSLFFLELWSWLGEYRKNSLLAPLTTEQLSRINIIVTFNGKFINLNLGELDFWRKGGPGSGKVSPEQMQKRLYKSVVSLAQAGFEEPVEDVVEDDEDDTVKTVTLDPVGDDTSVDAETEIQLAEEADNFVDDTELDDEDDFEIVKRDSGNDKVATLETGTTIDDGVEKACQKYIEAGTISTKEYTRIIETANAYKDIPNPFGEGTVADMLEVTPEEMALEEETLFEDDTVFDKSMLKNTTNNLNRDYIQKVLPKDIVSSAMAIQRAGVMVKDYKVDEVIDAGNRLQVHTLTVEPVKGRQSTIRYTTPLLDEEGYWLANDIRCTLRKQRVDLPIRKTSPSTVALTTFYGKNFVQRSTKATADYGGWLTKQLVAVGFNNKDTNVDNLQFSNVFDPKVKLPRDYTAIAQRFSGFTAGGTVYNFDISKVAELYGQETVDELATQQLTPIGKSKSAVIAMDPYSTLYKKTATGMTEIGSLPEVIGLNVEKAPNMYTELSMMGNTIPLAVIFGYYLGLENALKEYKVQYRIVESGERVSKDEGDLIIPLRDSKVVITFDNPEQKLIFHGFKPYLKIMKDFTLNDFNGKDVYLNLIQKDGLNTRYLNELDLMETMFVDPISERILKKMKEPTHFKGLLKRSNELVVTDHHLEETNLDEMHIYGYQRMAGAVYTGLVRGIRDANNKPGNKPKIDIPSNAIWTAISSDPATTPASDANPMQSVKEADVVTYGGTNGRSRRSMVKRTRQFHKSDLGVISGDTVDSGDVGITSYMSANPILADLDGTVKPLDRDKLDLSNYVSAAVQLAPGTMYDDDKRLTLLNLNQ